MKTVTAKQTVTFSFAKKGFYLKSGADYTGQVKVVDIGIPKKVIALWP